MSAMPESRLGTEAFSTPAFAPMRMEDLGEIQEIENDVYPFPWTRGNFLDSMYSGYETWTLRDGGGALIGYFLLMLVVDEGHLLNLTIRSDLHGRGLGRAMLDQVAELARENKMESLLLEVRPSNTRAQAVYQRYGFVPVGLRKGYYPAAENQREDAIVMRLKL